MTGLNDFNEFAKIRAKQGPGGFPAITLDQTAQGQDGLPAVLSPGHARAFQALGDPGFASGLDHATGNGPTLLEIMRHTACGAADYENRSTRFQFVSVGCRERG